MHLGSHILNVRRVVAVAAVLAAGAAVAPSAAFAQRCGSGGCGGYSYGYARGGHAYYAQPTAGYQYAYAQPGYPNGYYYTYAAQPAPTATATPTPAQPAAAPATVATPAADASVKTVSFTTPAKPEAEAAKTEAAKPAEAEAAKTAEAAAVPATDPYGFTNWLNGVRAQYGLPAVAYDDNLSRWADQNNAHQNSRGLGHFVMGPARRQNSAMGGYGSIGSMWLASPAHASALLDPSIRAIGIAGSGAYWTFNAY
jgi:uncharacterized protein YkwD